MTKIDSEISDSINELSNVPGNNGNKAVMTYQTPFDSSVPSSTIDSTFPDILGDSSESDTLIGNTIAEINQVGTLLIAIHTPADAFTDNVESATSQLPIVQSTTL